MIVGDEAAHKKSDAVVQGAMRIKHPLESCAKFFSCCSRIEVGVVRCKGTTQGVERCGAYSQVRGICRPTTQLFPIGCQTSLGIFRPKVCPEQRDGEVVVVVV